MEQRRRQSRKKRREQRRREMHASLHADCIAPELHSKHLSHPHFALLSHFSGGVPVVLFLPSLVLSNGCMLLLASPSRPMPLARSLTPALIRAHTGHPPNRTLSAGWRLVQSNSFSFARPNSGRRTLTSTLRRLSPPLTASCPSTNIVLVRCNYQIQQKRDLSFLGTLRAVFKQ